MVWPLALSLLTVGFSLLGKDKKEAITIPSTNIVLAGDDRLLFTGAVLGMGCALLLSKLASYFRIKEHSRMLWMFMTNTDESKELFPLRLPKSVLSVEEFVEKSKDGSVRLLVSSRTAPTSHLNVHVLTLGADCEIPPRRAPGVEFYYVASGSGSFSQKGIPIRKAISPGDCFVVDVGNMRWIRCEKTALEPLVLLRATDGGRHYTSFYSDSIRLDPNHKPTSLEGLSHGLQKVRDTAKGFYRKTQEDTKEG